MDFTSTVALEGPLSALLGFGAFVVFWALIVHLVAYGSGWKRAAEEFAMQEWDDFPDNKIVFGSLQIGSSNYTNSMTIAVNDMGIYLRPIWMFRMGHKPLFIPRSMVYEVEKNPLSAYRKKLLGGPAAGTVGTLGSLARGQGLMGNTYRITVSNPSTFKFTLGGKPVRRWGDILEDKVTEWK